jgi:hypothetical protein
VQVTFAHRSTPAHTPAVHLSLAVLGLPSLQAVPFVAAGLLHVPDEWLQVPATWHWSEAVQVTFAQRSTPAHTPAVHRSLTVFALPSLQLVPSLAAGLLHVPVE